MIKAFLFDMDGVLMNSEKIAIQIGIDYFKTLGADLVPEDFLPHLGMGEFLFFDGPAKAHGITYDPEMASRYHRDHFGKLLLSDGTCILPGAREIFQKAKKAGLMTAIASSSPRWKVETNIKALDLAPSSLDLVASGDDIKRNKPFGDIYQFCLERLRIKGEEAIVFEDALGASRLERLLAVLLWRWQLP